MDCETLKCHHCSAEAGATAAIYSLDSGVTSDCRPWNEEVRIFVCPSCGAVQAPINEAWRRSVEKIYRDYDTYAAAGGEEQKVLDSNGMSARSRVIVGWLASLGLVAPRGEVLDVGCGRGAFLREFTGQFPEWSLSGTEFDDRNARILQELPRFKGLQTARFDKLSGAYDVISMVHVLEHIESPVACLEALRRRARNGALLLVQVPDWTENAFALAIADHATHFTPAILERLARRAGWEPVAPAGHVVPKELTLLARAGSDCVADNKEDEGVESRLEERLSWLREVKRQAQDLRQNAAKFGIFGTAVAGTWLAGARDMEVDFFVDEDPSRIGAKHLGIPIISPGDAVEGSDVFVGMAPAVSKRLTGKYRDAAARFHAVKPLDAL
jgi:2-polyprenyl-3-methyl-5-hydroxy-6-metoxy-1,4-benzoquinol methylase